MTSTARTMDSEKFNERERKALLALQMLEQKKQEEAKRVKEREEERRKEEQLKKEFSRS